MVMICACAGIGETDLTKAFEAIQASKSDGEEITFKDLKEKIDLPALLRNAAENRAGGRCGGCVPRFLAAVKLHNAGEDVTAAKIWSAGAKGAQTDDLGTRDSGVCGVAKAQTFETSSDTPPNLLGPAILGR